jgi:hypothetical protein
MQYPISDIVQAIAYGGLFSPGESGNDYAGWKYVYYEGWTRNARVGSHEGSAILLCVILLLEESDVEWSPTTLDTDVMPFAGYPPR